MSRVAVFDAITNTFSIKMLKGKKPKLEDLQALVGGNIEHIPHGLGPTRAPFVAYANEEGFYEKRDELNTCAWGTLMQLGFQDSSPVEGAFCGNIVLAGRKGGSLTEADIETIKHAHEKSVEDSK